MSQSTMSPRCIRPAQVTVLLELRALRSSAPSTYLSRLENKVRSWRGLTRWSMQAHTSSRGETVVQIVAEKTAQSLRIDNVFSSWRRLLLQLLPVKPDSIGAQKNRWRRGTWMSGDGQHINSSWYADAKLLAESYDLACAKLWEEARKFDAASLRCSYLEPALPEPIRRPAADAPQIPGVGAAVKPPIIIRGSAATAAPRLANIPASA